MTQPTPRPRSLAKLPHRHRACVRVLGRLRRRSKVRGALAITAALTTAAAASGAAPAGEAPASRAAATQRQLAESSTKLQPFKATMLERKRHEGRVRVRLLVFTRSIHARTGSRIRVFSNELEGAAARARERRSCDCSGLWVVTTRKRAGRRFLRALRARLKQRGTVEFAAEVRGEGAGPAAGFRLTRYNRKVTPFEVTD